MRFVLARLDSLVTPERVRNYGLILCLAYVAGALGLVLTLRQGLDPQGKPLGADFIIFYGTSHLALQGRAVLAWTAQSILLAERASVPASRGLFLWCYPPTFLLLVAPLAKLPYAAALAAWLATTLAAYLGMVRLLAQGRRWAWLALAFPGVFVCAMQGQNGLLSAAVLGAGLLWLDRRPWLAGALLGLIAYKPHLGVLLPLLLVGTGRWRSVLAAGLSAAAFIALSVAAFGVESWRAFLDTAPQVRLSLEAGALPLGKMPTVFAAARQFGAPLGFAYGLQALAATMAAAAALVAWRRPGALPLKAGLAVTATLLATPYAFDYDLVLLAIPLGAMALAARESASPPGVRFILAVAALSPLVATPAATWLHLPLAPLVLVMLLAANLRLLGGERRVALAPAFAAA